MRPAASALALVSLLSLTTTAQQAPPSAFTGTWMSVAEPPAGLQAAPSPVLGPRFGLQVTATHAIFRRAIRGETSEVSLSLDGTTGTYRAAARPCEGEQEFHEQARWDDGAIALSRLGSIPAGGGALRPASVRIKVRPGPDDTLVVEGLMGRRGGGDPIAVGTVYRRSPTPMPDPPAPPPVKLAETTIGVLSWLPGTWSGLNGPETRRFTIEERWTPTASGSMQGMGRTLSGAAQTAFEFFCVSETHRGLVYTAWPNARPTPTYFYGTETTANMVKFENPGHDFPQVIIYERMPDGSLRTTISLTDGSRAQHFTMQKQ